MNKEITVKAYANFKDYEAGKTVSVTSDLEMTNFPNHYVEAEVKFTVTTLLVNLRSRVVNDQTFFHLLGNDPTRRMDPQTFGQVQRELKRRFSVTEPVYDIYRGYPIYEYPSNADEIKSFIENLNPRFIVEFINE